MYKSIIIIVIFLNISNTGLAQKRVYRHLYKNEINLIFKDIYRAGIKSFGVGYERSLTLKKNYLSLSNEFLWNFSEGADIFSTFRYNMQKRDVTTLGVGVKYSFKNNKTNFIAQAAYKYDWYKAKITISANIISEFYIPVSTPISQSMCNGKCPLSVKWHYGFFIGKYF